MWEGVKKKKKAKDSAVLRLNYRVYHFKSLSGDPESTGIILDGLFLSIRSNTYAGVTHSKNDNTHAWLHCVNFKGQGALQ